MAPKNQLYYGDNYEVLEHYIKDDSVDLIYLDPPFNSRQDYNVLFAEKDGSQSFLKDKRGGTLIQPIAFHPVLKPRALLSANGPQLNAPTTSQTLGTFRFARWADGFDTSVVTTVRSVRSAKA